MASLAEILQAAGLGANDFTIGGYAAPPEENPRARIQRAPIGNPQYSETTPIPDWGSIVPQPQDLPSQGNASPPIDRPAPIRRPRNKSEENAVLSSLPPAVRTLTQYSWDQQDAKTQQAIEPIRVTGIDGDELTLKGNQKDFAHIIDAYHNYTSQLAQQQSALQAQDARLRQQELAARANPLVHVLGTLAANIAQQKDMPGITQALGRTAMELNPRPEQFAAQRQALGQQQMALSKMGLEGAKTVYETGMEGRKMNLQEQQAATNAAYMKSQAEHLEFTGKMQFQNSIKDEVGKTGYADPLAIAESMKATGKFSPAEISSTVRLATRFADQIQQNRADKTQDLLEQTENEAKINSKYAKELESQRFDHALALKDKTGEINDLKAATKAVMDIRAKEGTPDQVSSRDLARYETSRLFLDRLSEQVAKLPKGTPMNIQLMLQTTNNPLGQWMRTPEAQGLISNMNLEFSRLGETINAKTRAYQVKMIPFIKDMGAQLGNTPETALEAIQQHQNLLDDNIGALADNHPGWANRLSPVLTRTPRVKKMAEDAAARWEQSVLERGMAAKGVRDSLSGKTNGSDPVLGILKGGQPKSNETDDPVLRILQGGQ